MNDLNRWLQSLGWNNHEETTNRIDEEVATPATTDLVLTQPQESSSVEIEIPHAETVEDETATLPLSIHDFNDILADNGFVQPAFNETEEITDESQEYDREEERASTSETLEAVLTVNEDNYPLENPDISNTERAIQELNEMHENEDTSLDAEDDVDWSILDEEQETPAPVVPPLIPLNSPTLLLNDATSRFSGAEWFEEIQKTRVIVAGCGGIGSWAILQIARMNPAALFMYDDDVVETANMSGQLYCQENVGKAKVDAMADMIRSYTTIRNIYAIKDKFKSTSETGDIMICGFDNMQARTIFFNAWKEHVESKPSEERSKCILLDGRLSIDTLQVFCLTGDNEWAINQYGMKYLFSDEQADATVCSLKQTSYLACMIGSVITNLFTNWVANTLNPIIPFDLPFFTEYDAQNMIFKTIK